MKCEIIKDLLPSYLDGLTSEASNSEIENHLKNCQGCTVLLEKMKTIINSDTENMKVNREAIKPFKKLNKRIIQAVLITLASSIFIVCMYIYLFGIGWRVHSDDLEISYSYNQNTILLDFELTNGKVLNAWTTPEKSCSVIRFTESFKSVLDDRGEHPNQFSYGIHYLNEDGQKRYFDDECIRLQFQNQTQTIYLKEVAEELGLQKTNSKDDLQ